MRDGRIRGALKAVARWVFFANLHGTRAFFRLRGEKPLRLAGTCGKCAACCEAPSIQVDKFTWYLPTLRSVFLAWHRHVNGFVLIDKIVSHRVFVFRCTHWDKETRRCDSYETRPGMCRDYPRALLWQTNPEFLPGCGYRAVDPKANALLDAMAREGVKAEAIERAKGRLKAE